VADKNLLRFVQLFQGDFVISGIEQSWYRTKLISNKVDIEQSWYRTTLISNNVDIV
jgi:hypothetical protein